MKRAINSIICIIQGEHLTRRTVLRWLKNPEKLRRGYLHGDAADDQMDNVEGGWNEGQSWLSSLELEDGGGSDVGIRHSSCEVSLGVDGEVVPTDDDVANTDACCISCGSGSDSADVQSDLAVDVLNFEDFNSDDGTHGDGGQGVGLEGLHGLTGHAGSQTELINTDVIIVDIFSGGDAAPLLVDDELDEEVDEDEDGAEDVEDADGVVWVVDAVEALLIEAGQVTCLVEVVDIDGEDNDEHHSVDEEEECNQVVIDAVWVWDQREDDQEGSDDGSCKAESGVLTGPSSDFRGVSLTELVDEDGEDDQESGGDQEEERDDADKHSVHVRLPWY